MEAFLRSLLPRMLPQESTFEVSPFQGKMDLLENIAKRLQNYAAWLPADWRVVVIVDRDNDDCVELKAQLENMAKDAGLRTRSADQLSWQVVNRIAVEELEAWYFGDWEAVVTAYPRVSPTVPKQRGFRNSDAISGGTWEGFERVMQKYGYFPDGIPKVEVGRRLGQLVDPARTRSSSFRAFCKALEECCNS